MTTKQRIVLAVIVIGALAVTGTAGYIAAREASAQDHSNHSTPMTVAKTAPKGPTWSAMGGAVEFYDVEAQSREFMGYYHTIKLTPEQEKIKKEVLEAIPAACCKDSTAYTCCCPCNLSKTLWGLSNFVLSKHHANAQQLAEVAHTWMMATNQKGYTGDSCYTGGCEGEFHSNGCGGMDESKLSV